MRRLVLVTLVLATLAAASGATLAAAPYPKSRLITGLTWDTATYQFGGLDGDIWPVTWGRNRQVYTAWGDGTIGCPTKVSYGIATIAGGPSATLATLSCGPRGSGHGKLQSLLDVNGTLYALVNLQNRPWPHPDVAVWSSSDRGRTWREPTWAFPGTTSAPWPEAFVQFGPGYAGARDGFVYVTAARAVAKPLGVLLLRAPAAKLQDQTAYEYFTGISKGGIPVWRANPAAARQIFLDPNRTYGPRVAYDAALGRYLLTAGHSDGGAGRIGLFEGSTPWGPWRTVDYEDAWLGMTGGGYLGVGLPTAWMGADGRTLWAVFSCGLPHHGCGPYPDRYNLMRATLTLAAGRMR